MLFTGSCLILSSCLASWGWTALEDVLGMFVHDIWVSASSFCMILYWSQVSLGVVGVCTADAAQPRGPSEPLTSWVLQPFKSPSFPFLCDFGGAEIHAVCDVESPHLEGKYIMLMQYHWVLKCLRLDPHSDFYWHDQYLNHSLVLYEYDHVSSSVAPPLQTTYCIHTQIPDPSPRLHGDVHLKDPNNPPQGRKTWEGCEVHPKAHKQQESHWKFLRILWDGFLMDIKATHHKNEPCENTDFGMMHPEPHESARTTN